MRNWAFFEQVRSAYLARAAAEPDRFAVIDASGTLDQVQEQIRVVLEQFLQQS